MDALIYLSKFTTKYLFTVVMLRSAVPEKLLHASNKFLEYIHLSVSDLSAVSTVQQAELVIISMIV
jgi:hypothetical protein